MRRGLLLKYGWVPTVLLMIFLALLEIYVSLRDDRFNASQEKRNATTGPDKPSLKSTQMSAVESSQKSSIANLEGEFIDESSTAGSNAIAELSASGFSLPEAETIVTSIDRVLSTRDPDPELNLIKVGIHEAFVELGLGTERERLAFEAYTKFLDESGFIRFGEWKICIEKKIAKVGDRNCLDPIVHDYILKVAESTDGDHLTLSIIEGLDALMISTIKKAEVSCSISKEDGFKLFQISLIDC